MMQPVPRVRARQLRSLTHRMHAHARSAWQRPRTLAQVTADAYARLELRQRAMLLARMLSSAGSLSLAVIGGGAFAKYIALRRDSLLIVSIEDAARTTASQVYELALYVEQRDPLLLRRLLGEVARRVGGHADGFAQPA